VDIEQLRQKYHIIERSTKTTKTKKKQNKIRLRQLIKKKGFVKAWWCEV